MTELVHLFQSETKRLIDSLAEELKGIRTGRAQTGMVSSLLVDTYGGSMKLKLQELAALTTEGNDTIVVMAFDPGTVSDIEKAILSSPLGITPKTEGNRITIRIPPLSEEQRNKYVKLVSQMIEETKQKIRHERESIRKDIKRMQDAKELTEDDRYRMEKEIDTHVAQTNDQLSHIRDAKEKEIMAV